MATYVVAGVTGRVGSVVARELLAKGRTVTGIARSERRAAAWQRATSDLDTSVAVGSLDDEGFVTSILKGAEGFFALLPEDITSSDFHGGRRRMAAAIANAVAKARPRRVVLLSALSAAASGGFGPGRGLAYLETALRETGVPLTIIRPSYFQENVASVMVPAREAGLFPSFMPSADTALPMTATSDAGVVAAEALLAAEPVNEVVDVLGPMYSMRQVAATLGAALGKPLHIMTIPPAGHIGVLMESGIAQSVAEAMAEMFAAFASGKISPAGDRTVSGSTTLAATVARLVGPTS